MRQVISIHVGQAGVQVGNSCWELFCLEHNIQTNGTIVNSSNQKSKYINQPQTEFKSFFEQTKNGRYVPRAAFFDLQPAAINKIKTGRNRQLFQEDQFLSGKEDASNIFARGYYTVGKQKIDVFLDQIRKQAEQCMGLSGFMIYHSAGGGTGSGFASLLYERLSIDYGRKSKMGITIFPSTLNSNTSTQPYNSVLTVHRQLEHMDVGIFIDNQALYNICRRSLEIELPGHQNMNKVIGRIMNSNTKSLRGNGSLHTDLTQFHTNLIPYPRLNFVISSYSPFIPVNQAYEKLSVSVAEHTFNAFQRNNFVSGCDPKTGKYLSCAINFGGDIVPKDVSASIGTIKTKRTIQFVDWCPTGFKCGITYGNIKNHVDADMTALNRQVSLLANSTAIQQSFARISYQFDLMYHKRAFVHHFVAEGMEEGEFSEARQDLAALEKDYEEVQLETDDFCPFDYTQY